MIYNSETFKWEGANLKMTKAIRQDYNEKLKLFIRKINSLKDTAWITNIDSLTEEEILKTRDGN